MTPKSAPIVAESFSSGCSVSANPLVKPANRQTRSITATGLLTERSNPITSVKLGPRYRRSASRHRLEPSIHRPFTPRREYSGINVMTRCFFRLHYSELMS